MSNNYDGYIPNFRDPNNKRVRGRKANKEECSKLANDVLKREFNGFSFKFPRMRFPKLTGLGYKSDDYIQIAKFILSKDINVWVTDESENVSFLGVYHNSNNFLFVPEVLNSPGQHLGTIVHEATHAIQDWKKWKQSDLEREVDGHFAGAYFMVLKNKSHLLDSSRYKEYVNLAKLIDDRGKYFNSFDFSRKVNDLHTNLAKDYGWKYRNDAEKLNDFQKRGRWDGIGA